MREKRAVAMLAFAALTALTVAPALAGTDRDRPPDRGGSVVPCSLSGVNPAAHPEIFNNPAEAHRLGFVLVGGVWQVDPTKCGGR